MSMAVPASSQVPRSEEIWQVVRLRLPLWMESDSRSGDGPPFRPWCVLGLRLPSRTFLQDITPEETQPAADRIGEEMVEAAGDLGFFPCRLEVAEAALAEELRRFLFRYGVEVREVESLPELDQAADALIRGLFADDPGLLAGDGVTLDQVASFAEASASCARAEPWRHLEEVDRIQVEAPAWGLVRAVGVLGWDLPERGVLFSPGPGEEEPWLVIYLAPWMIPAHDLYLWERHGLAVTGEDYPRVATPAGEKRRPDSRLLAFFEAVLRALAVTTEDEMDSGLWEKTVETALGPVRLILGLPDLLHPPEPGWDDDFEDLGEEDLDDLEEDPAEEWRDGLFLAEGEAEGEEEAGEEAEPATPGMEAQRLVYQAWESMGRRRVALVRQALTLWPGCADAWTLLAERERDPVRAVSLYARAVEEAGRAIDPALFESAGEFWAYEGQPYLSARFGLAEALWETDRYEEAIAHFQEVLRLDPEDHQGALARVVDALLLLDRDGEAARVLDAHPDERRAHPLYSRTLLALRREGDSPGARNCLTLALARNRFVPEYLLADAEELPEPPPPLVAPGSRSEAVLYAMDSMDVWQATPGALGWLRDRVSTRRKGGGRSGGKTGKKKGRR
ncbi:MAG: tetratricopeptide repeat protein [Acidobacteriota bacterium]